MAGGEGDRARIADRPRPGVPRPLQGGCARRTGRHQARSWRRAGARVRGSRGRARPRVGKHRGGRGQCLRGRAARRAPALSHVGEAGVDDAARLQMETALRLPVAAGGALMADAHVGYGLPIGGVLAVRDAVIPWAVGLDIACRLRLSVFELSAHVLGQRRNDLKRALVEETFFGAGVRHDGRSSHDVLDDPAWGATGFLGGLKDTARVKIGTSGSGKHIVEFGAFTVPEDLDAEKARLLAPLEAGRSYLALLPTRGAGASATR